MAFRIGADDPLEPPPKKSANDSTLSEATASQQTWSAYQPPSLTDDDFSAADRQLDTRGMDAPANYVPAIICGTVAALVQASLSRITPSLFFSLGFFASLLTAFLIPTLLVGASTMILSLSQRDVRSHLGKHPNYFLTLQLISFAIGCASAVPVIIGTAVVAFGAAAVLNDRSHAETYFWTMFIASLIVYLPIMLAVTHILARFSPVSRC